MSCKTKDRKKRNHKISYESLSSKVYNSLIQGSFTSLLCFETLVLAMHCYCGDNVKYQLLSKHVSKKATLWQLKNLQLTANFYKKYFPVIKCNKKHPPRQAVSITYKKIEQTFFAAATFEGL